jgi:hypothetical protein
MPPSAFTDVKFQFPLNVMNCKRRLNLRRMKDRLGKDRKMSD